MKTVGWYFIDRAMIILDWVIVAALIQFFIQEIVRLLP